MENNPLVSIVVLNWNGLEDTLLCIEHVKKIDYENFEIILVDNGSDNSQKEKLSKIENVKYIDLPKNLGFSGGHIEGLKHAKGDFILLLNNDAVIDRDYLKIALPIFSDEKVAVVGGRSYFWNEDNAVLCKDNQYYSYLNVRPLTGETEMPNSDLGINQIVNTVSGSSVIVRRKVIDQVGYLHDSFFAYYEETDLFARIKRAGYTVLYSPELRIWHKNGASSGAKDGSYFFFHLIFRNRFRFAIRNFELAYFLRFLKVYVRDGVRFISKMHEGAVQKTIGRAYLKAILENIAYLPHLIMQRRKIFSIDRDYSYCRTVLEEQTHFSCIEFTEKLDEKYLNKITSKYRNISNTDEILIATSSNKLRPKTYENHNIRIVELRNPRVFAIAELVETMKGSHFIISDTNILDLSVLRQAFTDSDSLQSKVLARNDKDGELVFVAEKNYAKNCFLQQGVDFGENYMMVYGVVIAELMGVLSDQTNWCGQDEKHARSAAKKDYLANTRHQPRFIRHIPGKRVYRYSRALMKWLRSDQNSRGDKKRLITHLAANLMRFRFKDITDSLKKIYKESSL